MAVAIATDHLAYWMLIATGVVTGTAFAFIGPARQAFIGDLVPSNMMGNAIVLQQASMNGTRVFGPALAGVLIATPLVGMAGVYALTTVGFIVATVSMVWLPLGRPSQVNRRSALAETRDGLGYVRRNGPVAILLSMSFFVVALGFPYQGFLASVARDEFHVGATGLGGLSSLAAVGALAATLWVANLTGHRHAWRIQTLAGAGFGISLILFALSPNFVAGLISILFLGALASAFQSLNNALTMVLAERQYYGRVQALMGLSWSLFGILSLPLGFVADAIGIRATLALMGVASLLSVAAMQGLAYLLRVNTDVRQDMSGEMVLATGQADSTTEDAPVPVLAKPAGR
jgi:MFS family permease